MENKNFDIDPNITNPNNPGREQTPVDPSNTSSIGKKVEQGVIDIKRGISEQSAEWEDEQERTIPAAGGVDERAETFIKDPSPEDFGSNDQNRG